MRARGIGHARHRTGPPPTGARQGVEGPNRRAELGRVDAPDDSLGARCAMHAMQWGLCGRRNVAGAHRILALVTLFLQTSCLSLL